jgi:hypothetical protein
MLNRQGLDLLMNFTTEGADPIVIYCSGVTERLVYACEFIFNSVLKVPFRITRNKTEFEASSHFKINYSDERFGGIVQVMPDGLLSETGITELKPTPFFKNDLIYFYKTPGEPGGFIFHFDIFSAVFYFISRYEEWQRFDRDLHGRFEAASSLLFQNKQHLKPVLDLWIREFAQFLEASNTGLEFAPKQFHVISTIDVDNLFAYKNKGLFRTAGAAMKDFIKTDFKNLKARISVISGRSADPFDIYENVCEFCSGLQVPMIWFFLFRSGTRYDRSVDPKSGAFNRVFKILKNKKALIGLHPSYDAAFEKNRLRSEAGTISMALGEPVRLSRQHYLRFDIRTTPHLLIENGIELDASMGFASSPGFRAGTSHPFYYFDFLKEKKTGLLFLPFCTMDGAYFVYSKTNPDETLISMLSLAGEVKNAGGFFVTVFHERTFSNHLYPGFGTLYKNLHRRLKEL